MDDLDPRQREVLKAIVQEHVATGEPVGSAAIARRDVAVSAATVRNVMVDLEELGFLEKPHTSAGRVPTDRGYRYYVDAFVQLRPPSRPAREIIEKTLPASAAADLMLRETSRLLSALSHYAAVVTTPAPAQVRWKRVEFVALMEGRVLAILLSPAGLVHNRLITLEEPISPEELSRAANHLNEMLQDLPLEAVRERISEQLSRDRVEYDELSRRALLLEHQVLDTASRQTHEVIIEGQGSFFEAPEFADLRRMRQLFQALEERTRLLEVLDRTLAGREVRIFIGAESDFSAHTGASVVAAPYVTETGVVGTIGIIGPTRMNYGRAIGLVDYTARVLSRLLEP